MAVQTRFPVQMEDVFPQGAYMIGEVIAANDFAKKRAGEVDPQLRDKISGQRVWQVRVLDPDPESRKGQAEVTVKVASDHQPVPPKGPTTGPFAPWPSRGSPSRRTSTPTGTSRRSRTR